LVYGNISEFSLNNAVSVIPCGSDLQKLFSLLSIGLHMLKYIGVYWNV